LVVAAMNEKRKTYHLVLLIIHLCNTIKTLLACGKILLANSRQGLGHHRKIGQTGCTLQRADISEYDQTEEIQDVQVKDVAQGHLCSFFAPCLVLGMARQDNTNQNERNQDKRRQNEGRQDKTNQIKLRGDERRREEIQADKTRCEAKGEGIVQAEQRGQQQPQLQGKGNVAVLYAHL
jgi:hypothetical protein